MHTRKIILATAAVSLVIASLVIARPGPVDIEEEPGSRYAEMLKSPAHVETIRSMGTLMLALPGEREKVDEQIARYAWYKAVDMSAAEMQLADSNMQLQLDDVSEIVDDYDITELSLIGMSLVGNVQNMDMFYSADTPHGPVIIRVSAHFPATEAPSLYGFAVFEGWRECRTVMPSIQHLAGKKAVSISYGGDADVAPTTDKLPAADES